MGGWFYPCMWLGNDMGGEPQYYSCLMCVYNLEPHYQDVNGLKDYPGSLV